MPRSWARTSEQGSHKFFRVPAKLHHGRAITRPWVEPGAPAGYRGPYTSPRWFTWSLRRPGAEL